MLVECISIKKELRGEADRAKFARDLVASNFNDRRDQNYLSSSVGPIKLIVTYVADDSMRIADRNPELLEGS